LAQVRRRPADAVAMGVAFSQECMDDLVEMSPFQTVLGVVLWLGSIISILPQLQKPLQQRSTEGLSSASVIIANLSSTLGLANVMIMKWQQLHRCKGNFWGCQPSLIQLYMALTGWALLFVQYLCFIWYPTEDLAEVKRLRLRHRKIWWAQVVGCGGLLALSAIWSMAARCSDSDPLRLFGISLGLASSLLVLVRYAPQVLLTVAARKSGAISKRSYFLLGVGGFLGTYFQVFGSKEQWSTWMPVFVGNCLTTAILALCCFYDVVVPVVKTAARYTVSMLGSGRKRAVTMQARFRARRSTTNHADALGASLQSPSKTVARAPTM